MEQKKLYIWQLQESTSIDKNTSYFIIYDQEVKKVLASKLFGFFNQDEKITNIQNNIEGLLREYDADWQTKYDTLDTKTIPYETWVKTLQEKFKDNENKIRELTTEVSKLENSNEDVIESFKDINSKYEILFETISNFRSKVEDLKSFSDMDSNNIGDINSNISIIQLDLTNIFNSFDPMYEKIDEIKKYDELNDETNKFLKRIDDEYDKIVAIIDHYHHIHDENDKTLQELLSKHKNKVGEL